MFINNVKVATPKIGGVTVTDEPIWAPETGRSTTGKMIGDIIAWKTTVAVSWPPLTFDQAKKIRDAIRDAGSFFVIEYPDFNEDKASSETGDAVKTISKTVYADKIPRTLYSLVDKHQRYNNITINFVEQ